jgi:hypothetical protein
MLTVDVCGASSRRYDSKRKVFHVGRGLVGSLKGGGGAVRAAVVAAATACRAMLAEYRTAGVGRTIASMQLEVDTLTFFSSRQKERHSRRNLGLTFFFKDGRQTSLGKGICLDFV